MFFFFFRYFCINYFGIGHPTDDYQCTGNLEADFLEVTVLLGLSEIPTVTSRPPAVTSLSTEKGVGGERALGMLVSDSRSLFKLP